MDNEQRDYEDLITGDPQVIYGMYETAHARVAELEDRVKSLEAGIRNRDITAQKVSEDYKKLEAENARLREALEDVWLKLPHSREPRDLKTVLKFNDMTRAKIRYELDNNG